MCPSSLLGGGASQFLARPSVERAAPRGPAARAWEGPGWAAAWQAVSQGLWGDSRPLSCLPHSRQHSYLAGGSVEMGPGFAFSGFASHLALPSLHRMDDSYCLSALRSPFYPIPTPGSLPPLHPSAMHLHLSGVRYPPELSHSSLAALHSERMSSLSAER